MLPSVTVCSSRAFDTVQTAVRFAPVMLDFLQTVAFLTVKRFPWLQLYLLRECILGSVTVTSVCVYLVVCSCVESAAAPNGFQKSLVSRTHE